ncbi:MAG: hypothetical protein G01um101425_892 [Candidatus Peregrinibacteria bacterium Gr01-1014_25]|nr:MAG: hypothetical protein G01um101425_892 [Candidatus Peregrinibacteria bacterium Gr01-1014_25]
MRTRTFVIGAGILCASLLGARGLAQVQDLGEPTRLTIGAGDVLEILPVHSLVSAEAAWIRTQDRTFLEASKDGIFRTRIVQPGEYIVTADFFDADRNERVHGVLALTVLPREEFTETAFDTFSGSLIRTSPARGPSGAIPMDPTNRIVQLHAADGSPFPLHMDIDAATDADGNGTADDDTQNAGTFFQTEGTTLTVWFLEPVTERSLMVFTDDRSRTDGFSIGSAINEPPEESTPPSKQIRIVHGSPEEDGTVAFTVAFDEAPPAEGFLTEWTFGDGEQSLLANPQHTFSPGTYTVVVRLIDIASGNEIARTEESITVAATTTGGAASSAAPQATSSAAPQADRTEGGGISWLVLVVVFVLSMIAGAVILLVLRFVRKSLRKLPTTIEKMEAAIVKTPADEKRKAGKTPEEENIVPAPSVSAPTPADTATTADTGKTKEMPPAKEEPKVPAAAELVVDTTTAPPWLAAGLAEQAKTPEKEAAPAAPVETKAAASETPTTPPPVISFAPVPQPGSEEKPWTPPAPKEAPPAEPVPAWLQRGMEEATQQTGVPAAVPTLAPAEPMNLIPAPEKEIPPPPPAIIEASPAQPQPIPPAVAPPVPAKMAAPAAATAQPRAATPVAPRTESKPPLPPRPQQPMQKPQQRSGSVPGQRPTGGGMQKGPRPPKPQQPRPAALKQTTTPKPPSPPRPPTLPKPTTAKTTVMQDKTPATTKPDAVSGMPPMTEEPLEKPKAEAQPARMPSPEKPAEQQKPPSQPPAASDDRPIGIVRVESLEPFPKPQTPPLPPSPPAPDAPINP